MNAAARYRVATAYRRSTSTPIRCGRGESVQLGRRDDQYPGWVRVMTVARSEGWAPQSMIEVVTSDRGLLNEDYDARELTTKLGEEVTCIRQLAGWAWVENAQGDSGWVPLETLVRI